MTDLKALSLKLDDAMDEFSRSNDDGFGNLDHLGARDLRDEGFEIAREAMVFPTAQRQIFTEDQIECRDAFGRDVIAAAAWYRLAELSQ